MSKVLVAVRVRPFNDRERRLKSPLVVHMAGTQTTIEDKHIGGDGDDKSFTFDHSMWSHTDDSDPAYSSQSDVYDNLGVPVLDNAFNGYNACIFAYGQTGSGKTYTMMGSESDPGLIPRICEQLFVRAASKKSATVDHTVEVSYLEIYNDDVRDLLAARASSTPLKVREHKSLGPYVQGLTKLAARDNDEVLQMMAAGSSRRKTASTAMNEGSSRSHAVFTIVLTERFKDDATKSVGERVSKISLVDLAGSERLAKTHAQGDRKKEAIGINSSLSALGLVIKALATRAKFVPYRDSKLTWLLKENLGGNSKTIMVAAVSPAGDNAEESLSTLRYANSAKQIVNQAVVNEDPNARMIRELREELEMLRLKVGASGGAGAGDGGGGPSANAEELEKMRLQQEETEALLAQLNMTWEEKLAASNSAMAQFTSLLEGNQASIDGGEHSLKIQTQLPHLVRLNEGIDFGVSLYTIQQKITYRIGRPDYDDPPQDVTLDAPDIDDEHALIESEELLDPKYQALLEAVTMHPIGICSVNGKECDDSVRLHHGDRVQFGLDCKFRFNNPTEALRMKMAGEKLPGLATVGAAEDAAKLEAERAAMGEERAKLAAEKAALAESQRKLIQQRAEFGIPPTPIRKQIAATRAEDSRVSAANAAENERLKRQLRDMEDALKRTAAGGGSRVLSATEQLAELARAAAAERSSMDSEARRVTAEMQAKNGADAAKLAADDSLVARERLKTDSAEEQLAALRAERARLKEEADRNMDAKGRAEKEAADAARAREEAAAAMLADRNTHLRLQVDATLRTTTLINDTLSAPLSGTAPFGGAPVGGGSGGGGVNGHATAAAALIAAAAPSSGAPDTRDAGSYWSRKLAEQQGLSIPGRSGKSPAAGAPRSPGRSPSGRRRKLPSSPSQMRKLSGGAGAGSNGAPRTPSTPLAKSQTASRMTAGAGAGVDKAAKPSTPLAATNPFAATPAAQSTNPFIAGFNPGSGSHGSPSIPPASFNTPSGITTPLFYGTSVGTPGTPSTPVIDFDQIKKNLADQRQQFMARMQLEAQQQERDDALHIDNEVRRLRIQQQLSEDELIARKLQMQFEADDKRERFLRQQQLQADESYARQLHLQETAATPQ